MVRSFVRLMDVRPGFNPDHVLTVGMVLPRAKYKENEQSVAFYKQLVERVQALPGVRSASVTNYIPLAGSNETTTNYTHLGAATNVPAFYYRVRLVP